MVTMNRLKVLLVAGALAAGLAGVAVRRGAGGPVAATPGEAPCAGGTTACQAKVGAAAGGLVAGHPRLLVFSSQDCPACQRMAPVVQAAERSCAGEDDVLHVTIDTDDGQAIASRYAVSLLPSFVSVDADGHEVARLAGVQPLDRLEHTIEEIRGTRCARLDVPGTARAL